MNISRGRYTLSEHFLDAYRIHHADADPDAVFAAIEAGIDVPEGTARAMLGRPWNNKYDKPSIYRLAPDRRGLFAFVEELGLLVGITYLRFQHSQEQFARTHWPLEQPPATPPAPPPEPPPEDPPLSADAQKRQQGVLDWIDAQVVPASSEDENTPVQELRIDYERWALANARKREKPGPWATIMSKRFPYTKSGKGLAYAAKLKQPAPAPVIPPPPVPLAPAPTKEQVYDHVIPEIGVPLRDVRIMPGLQQFCGGGAVAARRALFAGKPSGPPEGREQLRWRIQREAGAETDVLLFRVHGMFGDIEWHAGTPGSEPPVDVPVTGPPPKGPTDFIYVRRESPEWQWKVVRFEEGRSTRLINNATRADAILAAKGGDLPVFVQPDCVHCGSPVYHEYMVLPEVWAASHAGPGVLHLWCLEERLGRDLTLNDLSDAPINDAILFGFRMARTREAELQAVAPTPAAQADPPGPFRAVQIDKALAAWVTARVIVDAGKRLGFLAAYEDYERWMKLHDRVALPVPKFRSQLSGVLGEPKLENGVLTYAASLVAEPLRRTA